MKILVLDNYDSFTFNLVHLLEKVSGQQAVVVKNDGLSVGDAEAFDRIVLSPGPGLPGEAGIMPALLKTYSGRKPILGVCLGLQAIGEHFGAKLQNLPEVCHGKASEVRLCESDPLFAGCPAVFRAGRYHSWVIDRNTIPDDLVITAEDHKGNIMALRHRHFNVRGVQFHPESILSEFGEQIISNWLSMDDNCLSLPK